MNYRRDALTTILEETAKPPLLALLAEGLLEAVERPDGCTGFRLTARGEQVAALLMWPEDDEMIPFALTEKYYADSAGCNDDDDGAA